MRMLMCTHGRYSGDVKVPLTNLLGEVDSGRGSCPSRKSRFLGPNRQLLPARQFRKIIALAFLKATYPQIPY